MLNVALPPNLNEPLDKLAPKGVALFYHSEICRHETFYMLGLICQRERASAFKAIVLKATYFPQ